MLLDYSNIVLGTVAEYFIELKQHQTYLVFIYSSLQAVYLDFNLQLFYSVICSILLRVIQIVYSEGDIRLA